MSSVEYSGPEGILNQFKKYQEQLASILQAYSANQDDALLSGFLTFAHSKCNKYFDEILRSAGGQEHAGEPVRGAEDMQLTMDCLWKSVHYPVFKWFQLWRQHLVSVNVDQKPRYVELRKLNSKLTKFFKVIHKFYYGILEKVNSEFDLSEILPHLFLQKLNIQAKESPEKTVLRSDDQLAVSVIILVHRSLLNLGSCHRYKSMCEKFKDAPQDLQYFKKSMRYFNLATLVLPSVGEPYLQEGLIYVQTKNFGLSTYSFARSALSRLPSAAGLPNFLSSVCDPNSKIFTQVMAAFHDIFKQERDGRVVNREIIEIYFLVLFCANFAPALWSGENGKCLLSGARLQHIKEQYCQKAATRYAKNLPLILQNEILLIGGFDLLKAYNSANKEDKAAQKVKNSFLGFSFDLIGHFIDNVVVKEIENEQEWVYLAFVRVANCWLMSNKAALQFAHRDVRFCDAMMRLTNSILKSATFTETPELNHRPRRPYFFEEDVSLRDFKSVKFSLSDFNDEEVFSAGNASGALIGMVDKRLSKKDEHRLRLEAVGVCGKRFLAKNACGIQFVDGQFVKSAIKTKAGQSWAQKVKYTPQSNIKKSVSMRELESQVYSEPGPASWGYSGSSVPQAPASIKARPSTSFTERPLSRDVSTPSFTKQKAAGSEARTDFSERRQVMSSAVEPPLSMSPASGSTPNAAVPQMTQPMQFYAPHAAISSPAIVPNAAPNTNQMFEAPFYPNVPLQMVNNPYMQYWPQAYPPPAYNPMAPLPQNAALNPSAPTAPQQGTAGFQTQNPAFMGNFAYPQY
ncbi:LAQU0S04e09208g1_1 [Lachancea quebecensis]|uniref:LAQU0S04e09208g1_1 n=1 Tax=Lachancea quebecensis TaxID=1654605 RepID=A0A0P1KR70_9SACH|nr:LAQU0S04e09208g1_1 [Lachancea quebecensis]